jgi:hypothetical protein
MGTAVTSVEGYLLIECKFDYDEDWRLYQRLPETMSIEQARPVVDELEKTGAESPNFKGQDRLEFRLAYVRVETTKEVL